MTDKEAIIKLLDLQPHPEGGFFKETYRSPGIIPKESLDDSFGGDRNHSTSIYFMLTSENFSAFHRIKADEGWHFYLGSPIRLHTISAEGDYTHNIIGNDIMNGEQPQLIVNAGDWFASEVVEENSFSLVGCTVSPGFSYEDFEMAQQTDLINKFPQHKELILQFTR